jgi:hypothetical protein
MLKDESAITFQVLDVLDAIVRPRQQSSEPNSLAMSANPRHRDRVAYTICVARAQSLSGCHFLKGARNAGAKAPSAMSGYFLLQS